MARVTRLTQHMRKQLKALARDLVKTPAEDKAVKAAYKAAAPLVTAAVHVKYPPRDMAVLLKYEKATVDDCIKLQLSAGGIQVFNFAEKKGPLVAHETWQGVVYAADEQQTAAVLAWVEARDKQKAAYEAKVADYDKLINFARTLDEIEAVWPEASQVRAQNESVAPVVLPEEVVKRIKADVATRH